MGNGRHPMWKWKPTVLVYAALILSTADGSGDAGAPPAWTCDEQKVLEKGPIKATISAGETRGYGLHHSPAGLSRYAGIAAEVTNTGKTYAPLYMSARAEKGGRRCFGFAGLYPGETGVLHLDYDEDSFSSLLIYTDEPASERIEFTVNRVFAVGDITFPSSNNGRKEGQEDLKRHPGVPHFNKYGGWADGPTLEATGWFRTEKYKGKWWLVDPEGKLFLAHGIHSVRNPGSGGVDHMLKRFRSWGVTCVGGHSYYGPLTGEFPYTLHLCHSGKASRVAPIVTCNGPLSGLRGAKTTSKCVPHKQGGKVISYEDLTEAIYRPLVRDKLRTSKEVLRAKDDPYCIGIFINNELTFPGPRGAEIADMYFRVNMEEIRKACPHMLYLGAKVMHGQPDGAWEAMAKYCDVVSVNVLQKKEAPCYMEAFRLDKPAMLSAFNIDHGTYGSPPRQIGRSYEHYVKRMFATTTCVGTLCYQYSSSSCGWIDDDVPHPYKVEAGRRVGETMYRIHMGELDVMDSYKGGGDGAKPTSPIAEKKPARPEPTPVPLRAPRVPRPDAMVTMDGKLVAKLERLQQADALPEVRVRLSLSSVDLMIAGGSTDDNTIRLTAGKAAKPFPLSKLSARDKAVVAMACARAEPDNMALQGLIGFYLECAGDVKRADAHFDKAGAEVAKAFEKCFEP